MHYLNFSKKKKAVKMKKKYTVTWEERHKKIIEANNLQEAKEIAFDVQGDVNTYEEITYQEVTEKI